MAGVTGTAESAMAAMIKASTDASILNSKATAEKIKVDTNNAIAAGQVDSANKTINAATQAAKSIQY